jgi:hypothetical protein
MAVSGAKLHLNAGTNEMRVDSAGAMELLLKRDFQGKAIPQGLPLLIQWQDKMIFDGLTATFEGGIVAETPGQLQTLRTEVLKATMKRQIRFDDVKEEPQAKTDRDSLIEHLFCCGGVRMESREFDDKGQLSLEYLEVPTWEITMSSGAIRSDGPGRLKSIRRDPPQVPVAGAPAQPGKELAQPAKEPAPKKPLSFLGVHFQKGITGNLQYRELAFEERVVTVFTQVDAWDADLDPRKVDPEGLGPEGALLTCDRLSMVQMLHPSGKGRTMGLEANGNTVVDGQKFTARSVRMTYDQSKGLLTFQGNGRTDARLFLRERPGEPSRDLGAQTIHFWPLTRKVQIDRLREMEGSLLGR